MDEIIKRLFYKKYKNLYKHKHDSVEINVNFTGRVVILHDGNSSTLAYFHNAFRDKFPKSTFVFENSQDSDKIKFCNDDIIIIIRFISRSLQAILTGQIHKFSHIIYFMDDDLLDPLALHDLPKQYRKKLLKKSAEQHRWLTRHCDNVWVSTAYLESKYAHLKALFLGSKPSKEMLESGNFVKIAYHGTSSHQEEKKWLFPVISKVLASCPNVVFEIFGEHEVYKLYRQLPRVSVLHPMSWENYLEYTKSHSIDIGLAPLLDSKFNQARGAVKYFDFIRMNAVGIYSNVSPYADVIIHDVNGQLISNSPLEWVSAIINLVNDSEKRALLFNNSYQSSMTLFKLD